jgi:predicted CXXCH cytochrome family protein
MTLRISKLTNRIKRSWRMLLFGGLAAWGALLVSCISVNRTLVAPPQIAGAKYVGSKACAQCHIAEYRDFADSTHGRLMAQGNNNLNIGCESCHGPGSLHVASYGAPHTIINPRRSPQTCFQCHLDKRGEFALPHSHPVLSGKVSCIDCHNPHRADAVIGGGAENIEAANQVCLRCHVAQRGPFVFEHQALREGCVTCHNPHGTVNDKMLIARNQTLCLQCHYQAQTSSGRLLIGTVDHTNFVTRGTCWSSGCHEAVHGSQVSNSLRY